MMRIAGRTAGLAAALLLAVAAPPSPAEAQMQGDLHAQAEELRREGRWKQALSLWASIPDSLIRTGRSDPRVGPAFLATAIEHDQKQRFEEGSKLYLWGFSGENLDEFRDEVVLEARRILPLLSRRDSVRWMPYLEGPTTDLARRVARYWLEHDPTPETDVNERLIEHWRRIVEARKRFTYNRSSVYGTDDRGIIYVKYGPPDNRARGHLGASEMELKIRVEDPLFREKIRRYDTQPQFELWKYHQLHPEEFTYFLFGNVRGTGPFQLVETPSDLIPDAARTITSAGDTPGRVRVRYYLELFYYRDLAILGGRFGRRFDELAGLWDNYTMRRNLYGAGGRPAPTEPTLEAFAFKFEEEDRYHPPGVPKIPIRSEFEGPARGVEMVVQAVRVLGREEKPTVVVQALAAPRMRFARRTSARGIPTHVRDTEHTLILRDAALQEAGRLTRLAPAEDGGISVFHLLNPPQPMHITVYGRPVGERVSEGDTLSLAGQGHAYIAEPLSADPDRFEMSDLAVGTPWNPPGGVRNPLPFPLLPGTRVWTGDALRVYLELYHLRPGPDGTRRYELNFRLLPLDEFGQVKSSPKPVTLGIQLETDRATTRRFFDIGLAGVAPGFYRLEVEAADQVAGRRLTRVREVEVIG